LLLVFAGCGAKELTPPVFGPTPLEETSIVSDQILVAYRVERVEEMGATEFRFGGSVRNLGPPVENGRFEVWTTRNTLDPNGNRTRQIVASQSFGRLLSQQVQPIAVTAIVPSVSNVTVTGAFAHD
jgi:hypothetical protein